jgi:maltose-binding protein MalE
VKVNYKPVGNNVPTVLATAIAGGHPPDMADIAQPGLVKQFAEQGHLKPITYAKGTMAANFAPAWQQLGTFNGKLYALVFKAANKSLLWYNVPAFKTAGVTAPKTWAQLAKAAKTIQASGTPAYSIGGADGWTLTDLFENIYLRTFGPAKYNALSAHKIKWTDSSVTKALKTMAQVLGSSSNLAGGTSGALTYGFNDSVTNAFSSPPKAAMVFEGDFVAGVILSSTKAKPKTGFDATPFPAITPGANASAVEIGGDLFVTFRDTPAIEAFVKFLASADAAKAWAKLGGFGTGNKNVPTSIYPDAITRATEAPIGQAKAVVFDMSDEQPASFGATTGQGEWGIFQQFLKSPSNVSGIQKKLEAAATAAYKKGK